MITPESNRIIHPEGKQPRKEKEEDPLKYSFMNIAEYKILNVILREFAMIRPTDPESFISRTFRTTEIKENTSSESFERLSWLSVATACIKASDVPFIAKTMT